MNKNKKNLRSLQDNRKSLNGELMGMEGVLYKGIMYIILYIDSELY